MASFTINVRDEALKSEIGQAFAASFSNADNLTEEQLVVKHVSNYIRGILNEQRVKVAKTTAEAGVTKETTLE